MENQTSDILNGSVTVVCFADDVHASKKCSFAANGDKLSNAEVIEFDAEELGSGGVAGVLVRIEGDNRVYYIELSMSVVLGPHDTITFPKGEIVINGKGE